MLITEMTRGLVLSTVIRTVRKIEVTLRSIFRTLQRITDYRRVFTQSPSVGPAAFFMCEKKERKTVLVLVTERPFFIRLH